MYCCWFFALGKGSTAGMGAAESATSYAYTEGLDQAPRSTVRCAIDEARYPGPTFPTCRELKGTRGSESSLNPHIGELHLKTNCLISSTAAFDAAFHTPPAFGTLDAELLSILRADSPDAYMYMYTYVRLPCGCGLRHQCDANLPVTDDTEHFIHQERHEI